jgi:mannosyltransferase
MMQRVHSRLANVELNSGYQYGILAVITLLATALRFYKLGEWSFWIDEVYTMGHAQAHYSSLEAVFRNIPPATKWVPLSVMLSAGALDVLGVSEWSARFVPVVIGVISVPALYFPIKRLSGPRIALIAVLLMAVSPWHLYWSQSARFYTSLMLLYTLALISLYAGLERDKLWYVALFLPLLYLAMSERLVALFAVPVVACYVVLLKIAPFEKPPGLRLRNLSIFALPALIAAIVDISRTLTTGSSTLTDVLEVFAGTPNHSPFRLLASIAYRLGIPLITVALGGGVYLVLQRRREGLFALMAAVVPVVVLTALAPFAFTIDRYIFTTLPFWVTLAAVGVHQIYVGLEGRKKLLALGVLAALVGSYLGEDVLYFTAQNGNRPDWRGAFQVVERKRQEGDLVLATRPELGQYYLDEDVQSLSTFDPDAAHSGGQRIWFVIDEATSYVDPATEQWVSEHAQLIDVLAISLPSKSLNIRIYLYDPARAPPS